MVPNQLDNILRSLPQIPERDDKVLKLENIKSLKEIKKETEKAIKNRSAIDL